MEKSSEQYHVVADIGGTNARFALSPADGGMLQQERIFKCDDYPNISAVFKEYFSGIDVKKPTKAAIAIANPITGDWVKMTNHHWQFSIKDTKESLGLSQFIVLNDFTALAMSLPHLKGHDLEYIGGGDAVEGATLGLIGPGTGLGVSGLIRGDNGWYPLESEGGHATFTPVTDRERDVADILAKQFGHVSFERLVSGPGLVSIYDAICQLDKVKADPLSPAQISKKAVAGSCELCVETVNLFCEALGTIAGNLALTLGARGGMYIGGGIIPQLGDFFIKSGFKKRFIQKGRYDEFLSQIPMYLIKAKLPALVGVVEALKQAEQALALDSPLAFG